MSRGLGFGFALFLIAFPFTTFASAFFVDANTGPDSQTTEIRLYLSNDTPAPAGYQVWFVADLNHNSVPTAPSAGAILGTDAVLIRADTVAGTLSLGDQSGRYYRNKIEVDERYATADIYFYLWNTANPALVGIAGQNFGFTKVIVSPPSGMGNVTWTIDSPVFADSFTVQGEPTGVVPEPSITMLLFCGAALTHLRRPRPQTRPNQPRRIDEHRC